MTFIITNDSVDLLMEPTEYDRIADLLCQIRSKIANNLRTTTEKGRWTKELYLNRVNALLINTDELADVDQKGLL